MVGGFQDCIFMDKKSCKENIFIPLKIYYTYIILLAPQFYTSLVDQFGYVETAGYYTCVR